MNEREDLRGVHLWLVLWRSANAVAVHARRQIEAAGLGPSDFGVLEVLHHKGPLPVNGIGQKVLLSSGSITPAVDRLEARGLVRRTPDPGDRRVRRVELTAAGKRLMRAEFPRHEEALERAAAALDEEERRTLIALLKKLGYGAEESARRDCRSREGKKS